jgi:uncharacterized protein with HEPN domain/predicted nucleotidyltransferase
MISEFEQHHSELEALCQRFGVARLELFGSALTENFRPDVSDLDFIVTFEAGRGAYDDLDGLRGDLETLFGRSVDLITYSTIENPYFRAAVDATKVPLCPGGSDLRRRDTEVALQRDVRMYLYVVERSGRAIRRFLTNQTFADYMADELLRAGVERQFTIIGEALNTLAKVDPEMAASIRGLPAIIGFRNFLVHNYDDVDHEKVWKSATVDLPLPLAEVRALLEAAGELPDI